MGDDLGQHRVEVRRHRVALREPRVDADAGAGRQPQQADPAGGGREAARGVLGVQADLDRVPARRRRIALEPAAGRDVELEGDEVGARHDLGDGVLDLQPRVDLHERELLGGGLVEELDGGGAAVSDLAGELGRGRRQLALLLGAEDRAGRLLDHLLVAALVGAVAHAERPHAALPVGQELDLDVPRGLHEALHQHRVVAERLARLGAGSLERVGDLAGLLDASHAAAAAARRRLDHQREAELVADPLGVLDAVDRPAAPRRDRHAGLLGQLLGLDLVAERAHDVGVRPGEDDAEPLAQLGEGGVLGHEAPADPGGVGPGLGQGPLERLVVEVGGGRAEAVALVGLAHEQRVALGLAVERDHTDRLLARVVQLADGVDGAHRRLAAVDDGQAREGPVRGGHAHLV